MKSSPGFAMSVWASVFDGYEVAPYDGEDLSVLV